MNEKNQQIETTLHDIKSIMERSSRFISLSGWSGISAGICALAGAWYTSTKVECWKRGDCQFNRLVDDYGVDLSSTLLRIGVVTFVAALVFSFLFTWIRSAKNNVPIWGHTARRLMINVMIPLIVGGLFIYRMMQLEYYSLIAPACLLFYGLALVNASKYTLGEVRYLGYGQLILGILNLWLTGYGLYFWAAGFGVLHIIYGFVMWWKYEKNK
ncbi:MAG TPA: hypothetical protein VJT83_09250 [Chitinophagaceae bacterium]|nr:hypothetical protein [Chitinophagaceae bacterium]